MSTLKVAAINNPSASSGGLAISAAGNVTGAGLDLITTQSFSAVASISLNNVFSGDYDNYRVLVAISAGSTTNQLVYARLRASSTDNSSSYRTETVEQYSTTVSGISNVGGDGTKWTVHKFESTDAASSGCEFSLLNPGAAKKTVMFDRAFYRTNAGVWVQWLSSGDHQVATAYDGISLILSVGTMSGTVSVYGYKK